MSYPRVQFLGHCLYTLGKFVMAASQGKLVMTGEEDYLGLTDDKEDIDARVALVSEVLKIAQAEADSDKSVLKIMVFPECFFHGRRGAYEAGSVDYLRDKLVTVTKGSAFEHWLICFGTVNRIDRRPRPLEDTLSVVTFSIKGSTCHAVQKANYSQDLISQDSLSSDAKKSGAFGGPITFTAQSANVCSFEQDDAIVAIDICADHGSNRFRTFAGKDQAKLAHVQLVPSAGSTLFSAAVGVRPQGFLFNCDGWNIPTGLGSFDGSIEIVAWPKVGTAFDDVAALGLWRDEQIAKVRTQDDQSQMNGSLNLDMVDYMRTSEGSKVWFPHSQLWRWDGAKKQGIPGRTAKIVIDDADKKNYNRLFALGLGALHVYPTQDMPK